jgi:hypothetical protein
MSNGLPQTTVSDSSPSILEKDTGRESLLEATKWSSVCATRREMVSIRLMFLRKVSMPYELLQSQGVSSCVVSLVSRLGTLLVPFIIRKWYLLMIFEHTLG